MKQQLHTNSLLTIAFALFAFVSLSAQNFTFDADLEGFTENFGAGAGPNGIVEWDADGGAGALKLTRATNNANFGLGSNGNTDASIVGIDADATPIIKIVIKNLTSGRNVRVGAKGGDGVAGNANFNNILTANSGSYAIFYLDMTSNAFWNGNLTNFWIAIRGNYSATSDNDAAYISSIELLASLPADEESEYIKNPNFEDTTGIAHMSGGGTTVSRSLTADEAQDGDQSLRVEFTAEPTAVNYTFSSFGKTYAPAIPAGYYLTTTMWVKSTSAASIAVRLKYNDDGLPGNNGVDEKLETVTAEYTTIGAWQELTFEHNPDVDVNQVNFWFAIDWVDGDPNGTNPTNGNVYFLDNMEGKVSENPLSTTENVLANVSMFPNPATDMVNIKTLEAANIEVYNILGKQVKSVTTVSNEYSMNVSDLTSGVYLVKLTSQGKSATKKLIIK